MTGREQYEEYLRVLEKDGFPVTAGDLVCLDDEGLMAGSPWAGVLRRSPGNRFLLLSRGPYTKAASLFRHGIRPCLDDMAQMIGSRLKVRGKGSQPFRMGVNSALLIRGEGALLAAENFYELHALAMVVEKSCLAAVASSVLGGARLISLPEALMMRSFYLSKYSKKAGRRPPVRPRG